MKVELSPYTPSWRTDFERHRTIIESALSGCRPTIDHIGSTSLGDIAAKPIIDILVGLTGGQTLDTAVEPMGRAGYTYIEKFNAGMPYRRFFVKLVPLREIPLPTVIGMDDVLAFGRDYNSVANIHVMMRGTHHWMRHIAFRDYLRAHPEVRQAYQALKRRIAAMDFSDPLEYNAYKENFIATHQEIAVAWYGRLQATGKGVADADGPASGNDGRRIPD